ncbi:hypothetical protein [Nocardioides sp.]|uniref:hypothetical protein n=1 Tax=Nocardioides sp. TaxID=35761 RepID=UPI002614A18B|nr:hypothetical protein [Nocardioides sp.]
MTTLARARRSTRTLLGLAAAGTLLLASGCSAEDVADRVAEKAIENAGGGDANVDFDVDSGELVVETDEGSFSSGGSLPDDFPSDQIPLVDGDVIQAASSQQTGASGFVVLVMVGAGVDEALSEAEQLLLDAGYEGDPEMAEIPGMTVRQLTKAPYAVLLSGYEADGGTAVNYVISDDS